MIKKYVFWALFVSVGLVGGCTRTQYYDDTDYDTVNVVENLVIDERSVPIFPKKAALTTDTAQHFSLLLNNQYLHYPFYP